MAIAPHDPLVIALSRPGWRDFIELTKPKVSMLIVFTAIVGMVLASPGMVPLPALVFGTLGIAMAGRRSLRTLDVRLNHRLRGHLYGLAEARDTPKHRDRRRRRRSTPGAGLGGRDSLCRYAGIGVVHHHLHVDTAAFLGARDYETRGVPGLGPPARRPARPPLMALFGAFIADHYYGLL
jgi:hypothetical protein